MKVKGTVAIVTGAASGIGRALSEKLLESGARFVAILDVDHEKGQMLEEDFHGRYGQGKARFYKCDVSSEEQLTDSFKKIFDEQKRLNIVVNNAAILDEDQPAKTLSLNALSVIYGTELAKKYIPSKNNDTSGVVINSASVNAFKPSRMPAYAGSKAAILHYTRCLPNTDPSFQPGSGIRVGAVCPSFVETVTGWAGRKWQPNKSEWMPPIKMDVVITAFMKIIEDDTLNGTILTATSKGVKTFNLPTPEEVEQFL